MCYKIILILNSIFDTQGLALEKKSVTNNADIYIKFRNTLSLSLDTNSVAFDDFTGIEEIEIIGAINATVNSDLPYEVNTYLDSPIQNKDATIALPPNIVSIKDGSKSSYDTFTQLNVPIKLSDNNTPGTNNIHRIDLKLNEGLINKADVYKTVIKIEVNQK